MVIILLDNIFSVGIGLGGLIADRTPFGYRFGSGEEGFLLGLAAITSSRAHTLALGDLLGFFGQAGLWTGLIVAAGFGGLTVWTRRWRDDS